MQSMFRRLWTGVLFEAVKQFFLRFFLRFQPHVPWSPFSVMKEHALHTDLE